MDHHHHHHHQPAFKVKRKPVGFKDKNLPIASTATLDRAVDAEPHMQQLLQQQHCQSRSGLSQTSLISGSGCADGKGKSLVTLVANPHVTTQPTTSDVLSVGQGPPPYESTTTVVEVANQETTTLVADTHQNSPHTDQSSSSSTFLKTALDEARYFAGGLLPRPHESTKHYTILRHSPSIVFYRGPATSVAVTVFSSSASSPSEPNTFLPADRTVWLQQRGFSGDAGMKLKRLVGATSGNWLDVTPMTPVSEQEASLSNQAEERGWRRDIAKFMKKHAALHKTGRCPRETLVVRLPALVQDGYFRLVLCTGGGRVQDNPNSNSLSPSRKRKVLCSSPVFRVASTSIDPSIMRGASLKTLPIELGVMVGSTVTMSRVKAVLSPVANKVQGRLQAVQADKAATCVGATATYAVSGLRERISAAEAQYGQQVRGATITTADNVLFGTMEEGTSIEFDVVGSDDGPESPFPIRFMGKIVAGTGGQRSIPGMPTANLSGIPDDTLFRLKGTYLGWAKASQKMISGDWYEAVIRAGPCVPHDGSKTSVVGPKHAITVHLIHDSGSGEDNALLNDKLEVIVLGMLPSEPRGPNHEGSAVVERSIQVALSSLSRANWGPQVALQKIKDHHAKTAASRSTFSDKYAQARQQVQQRADSLPLHLAGVRTAGAEARDRVIGNGGYYIPRSSVIND